MRRLIGSWKLPKSKKKATTIFQSIFEVTYIHKLFGNKCDLILYICNWLISENQPIYHKKYFWLSQESGFKGLNPGGSRQP